MESIDNFNKSEVIVFLENNIKNNLTFLYNDKSIIFKLASYSIPPNEYELSTSLEKLYHINKYFNNFDKNIELINSLIESYNEKKLKIIFKDSKCFLVIYNPITKNSFELELNSKEKNINSKIDDLINIIKDDRKRIEFLEDKVSKLEKKILKLEESYKKENIINNEFFMESNIIKGDEKNLILNWLEFKPKKINLLLNSNRDGDSKEAFHRLCDGKAPTLGIIETTEGYRFGGFTTKTWNGGENENKCISDSKAFIFSLDTKKKYKVIIQEKAIGVGNGWLLFFGYNQNSIVTYDKGCSKYSNYIDSGAYNFDTKNENGGKKNFTIKSYEVYELN